MVAFRLVSNLDTVRALILHATEPKVLAVSRLGNAFDLGLPGGHIKKGESPEQALARELSEEVGLEGAEIILPIYEGPNAPKAKKISRIYYVDRYKGEPYAKEAGTNVAWIYLAGLVVPGGKRAWFNAGLIESLRTSLPKWTF